MKLEGKVSIITGAARGIGREIALTFAREGSNIAIADINEGGLKKVSQNLKEIRANAIASKVDISKSAEVKSFIEKVLEEFGTLDILVNNAVYSYREPFLDFDEDEWDKVFAVGLKGYFMCSKAAAREMVKKRKGKIINISSLTAIITMPVGCAYTASKAGVVGLTKSMAMELAPYGINVNAIAPGSIATELLLTRIEEQAKQARLNRIPLARFGIPEDIANAALFLASEDSNYITGQVLSVDGGFSSAAMDVKDSVIRKKGMI